MNYNGEKIKLKPQIEEGITKVKWVDKYSSEDLALNTFKSINQVWNSYVGLT